VYKFNIKYEHSHYHHKQHDGEIDT